MDDDTPTVEKTLWVLLYEQNDGSNVFYLKFLYAADEMEAQALAAAFLAEREGERRMVSLKMHPQGFVIVRSRLPGKVRAPLPHDRDHHYTGKNDGGAEDARQAELLSQQQPTGEGSKDDTDLAHGPGIIYR